MNDNDAVNLALLAFRVGIGIVFLAHGINHIFRGGKIKGTAGWFESLGMKPGKLHAYLAATTELSCGIGFALGLLTPLTAAGGVGILTVASWTHKGKFFIFKDGWEYNAMLAALFILVATTGAGRWSLDNALDLADDLQGTTGLLISLIGFVAAVALMLVFWRPAPKDEPAAA